MFQEGMLMLSVHIRVECPFERAQVSSEMILILVPFYAANVEVISLYLSRSSPDLPVKWRRTCVGRRA